MPFPGIFHVRLLDRSNLDPGYQHGILMSLLRALAALEVVAAHLRGQLFPSLRAVPDPALWYQALAFFTGFAHQAVVLFFVLSGYLVGGSLLNRLGRPRALADYAVDRLTRMWIVLVPAFVLTLAIGVLTGEADPARGSADPAGEYSAATFAGNLLGLQGMAVPRFGGNYSLWSLANEMWYYALFPLVLLPFSGRARAVRYGAALAAVLVASQLLFQIVLYFVIWLLGAAFSRVRVDAAAPVRLALLALLAALSVVFRLAGSNDILVPASFGQDFLLSLVFLAWLATQQRPARHDRAGTRLACALGGALAPFSFTLYVVHFPLLDLLRHRVPQAAAGLSAGRPGDLLVFAALLGAIVFLSWLFHLPFEAQTLRLRRVLKDALFGQARRRRVARTRARRLSLPRSRTSV